MATLFKEVNYTTSSLVDFIELGQIGLPDIQRPFVWKNIKVRDLFDSMYRGYPVGYLLFWQNAFTDAVKIIGNGHKQKPPELLIVDGQQRLTSLYAVLRGIPVLRENFERELIEIAFNPLQEKFEVSDAAIRKDPAFINNISIVWKEGLFDVVDKYLETLRNAREVLPAEDKFIKDSVNRLYSLTSFPFTALELASSVDEEQVAEVFVRINSKGTPLNQADFILTLMSVFWDDGRRELETFCRDARKPSTGSPSPFNHHIKPEPDQLLRVSIMLGFRRARLRNVYSILRGKDLETEEFSIERRDQQFEVLKAAQQRALDLTYWHDFLKSIRRAGYLGGRQITSNNNLIFAYTLYLMGRTEFGVKEDELRRAIARYFFMSNLTGRYTGSPESDMEFDLARLRGVEGAEGFVGILDGICDSTLTSDFWAITLPNDLATAAAYSPSLFSYYAALVLLDAKGLFSELKITDLLDPSVHSKKSPAERHHLFPRNYLKSSGITDNRDINQIANYALMEWHDNVMVSDRSPEDYVTLLRARFSNNDLQKMYYWHALPDAWESMPYRDFLERRRELMSRVIADASKTLAARTGTPIQLTPVPELVDLGEGEHVEFKSTLRINLHTDQPDSKIELASLKTIAGFLNGNGGTLVVGVADDGTPVGIQADRFPNEDKMHLHLINLLNARLAPQFMMYIHSRFDDYNGTRVMVVECSAANSPVFVKDGNVERFYIRTGTATTELTMGQATDYVKKRF